MENAVFASRVRNEIQQFFFFRSLELPVASDLIQTELILIALPIFYSKCRSPICVIESHALACEMHVHICR